MSTRPSATPIDLLANIPESWAAVNNFDFLLQERIQLREATRLTFSGLFPIYRIILEIRGSRNADPRSRISGSISRTALPKPNRTAWIALYSDRVGYRA